jgi:thymidylate synthase, flavin-dependent
MKVVTEPTVTLMSAPMFFEHPEFKLPPGGTPAERLIAFGGKGCYDSFGENGRSIKEHIQSLIASDHFSVLEHANFSVYLTGISRGLTHELVRHRHFSYSQRSTRYTEETGAAIVLDPTYAELHIKSLTNRSALSMEEIALINHFRIHCENALDAYNKQVKWLMEWNPKHLKGTELRKWARGKARQLLPHALETRILVTGNIRSWREFVEKRSNPAAEEEIRRLVGRVFNVIAPLAPITWRDFSPTTLQRIKTDD